MHSCFFRADGPWRMLTPAAQAIYLAIRFKARARFDDDFYPPENQSYFQRRVESYNPVSKVELGRRSGLNRNTVFFAIEELAIIGVLLNDDKIAVRWPPNAPQ